MTIHVVKSQTALKIRLIFGRDGMGFLQVPSENQMRRVLHSAPTKHVWPNDPCRPSHVVFLHFLEEALVIQLLVFDFYLLQKDKKVIKFLLDMNM